MNSQNRIGDIIRKEGGFEGKPRKELIVPELFYVEKILNANPIIFSVKPYKKDIQVRTIIFKGICSIDEGDLIRAYIQKYCIEEREDYRFHIGTTPFKKRSYFPREFQEKENAEKIEILNPNNIEKIIASFEIEHIL
jgi:hypothetical protein